MPLPDFIGIGAPRCGTTWLHTLLASHEQIYMPRRRKEVDYWGRFYSRGPEWYNGFFPAPGEAGRYAAIGEITANYIYYPQAAERIAASDYVKKLLLILRNPVDRAYSAYRQRRQLYNYRGSFEEALDADEGHMVSWGFYSRYLDAFIERFSRDQLLVLIFEEATADPDATKARLAEFLDVSVQGFSAQAGRRQVNASYVPRYRGLYARAIATVQRLRRRDMDWLINAANAIGAKRLLGRAPRDAPARPSSETQGRLQELYRPEIERLETLLELDLSVWRVASARDHSLQGGQP